MLAPTDTALVVVCCDPPTGLAESGPDWDKELMRGEVELLAVLSGKGAAVLGQASV